MKPNHSEFINQNKKNMKKIYCLLFAMLPLAAWAGEVKVTKAGTDSGKRYADPGL